MGKYISQNDLSIMDIGELVIWFDKIEDKLSKKQNLIGVEIIKELRSRLGFLMDVGLEYLSLSRSARSLSKSRSIYY